MNRTLATVVLCGLAALTADPAAAGDRDDRRYEHGERRADHRHERHDRDDRRWHARESGRDDRRHDRRDYRRDHGRDYRVIHRVERRPVVRHVVAGRYCDDHRHLRSVHYHVSPRDYYRNDYPRAAYRLHGSSRLDATLVVTLPLF